MTNNEKLILGGVTLSATIASEAFRTFLLKRAITRFIKREATWGDAFVAAAAVRTVGGLLQQGAHSADKMRDAVDEVKTELERESK